jgi:hypothetical protein
VRRAFGYDVLPCPTAAEKNHTVRATGIALHQEAGGDLEAARQIAAMLRLRRRSCIIAWAAGSAERNWSGVQL